MLNQVNKLAYETVNQAMIVADTVVGVSRAAAQGTAQLMVKVKKPLRDAADTGVRLNRISHKSVEKLVRVQAKAIERSVDAGAARLELAARAPSLQALVKEQVALLPETRKRLSGNFKEAWQVLVDAGNEINATLRVNGQNVKRKAPAKRAPAKGKRTARKATTAAKRKTKKTAATVKRTAKKTARKARKVA